MFDSDKGDMKIVADSIETQLQQYAQGMIDIKHFDELNVVS
jgi:hypothetical protein